MSNHVKEYELNEEQGKMVVAAMDFGKMIAASCYRPGVEMDDLCQEAYEGLCDAAYNYKPGGEAEFTTFAFRQAKKRVMVFIQHYGPGKMLSRMPEDAYVEAIPIEHPEGDDDSLTLEEVIPDTSHDEYIAEMETIAKRKELARKMTECLTTEEREMVTAFYGNDNQQDERIWRRFNMGKSAFYARLRAAVIKMKVYAQHNNTKL